MELINFDYFVKRGTVLTEMARTAEGFKDSRLNKLYQDMRTLAKVEFGETGSSTIDLIVWPYLLRHATPWLTPAQIQFYETGGKSDSAAKKARAYKVITDQINNGSLNIEAYVKSLEDMDKYRDRVAEYRAGGKGRKKTIHVGSDISVKELQDNYDATYDIIEAIEEVMDDPDNQHPLMQKLLDEFDEKLQNDIPTKKDDFSNQIARFVNAKDPKISIPFTKLNNLFNLKKKEMVSQEGLTRRSREEKENQESGVAGRQLGMINDLEELGSTPEELRALKVELRPVLLKIKGKMGHRKISRTKKGVHSKYHKFLNPVEEPKPAQEPEPETDPQYSDEIDKGYNMLYAIENAIVYTFNAIRNNEYVDEAGNSIIDPESRTDLLKLLKADRTQIKAAIDEGKKMGRQRAQNFINQSKSSSDPIRREAYEKVAEEYTVEVELLSTLGDPDSKWNKKLAAAKREIENSEQTKLSLLPKGVDLDLYATNLNTPELLNKFLRLVKLNQGLENIRAERKALNFIGKDAPKVKFGKTDELKKVQSEKYYLLKQIGNAKFSGQRKALEEKLYALLNKEKELMAKGHDKVPLSLDGTASTGLGSNKASHQKMGTEKRIKQVKKELDLLSIPDGEVGKILQSLSPKAPDYSYNRYHLMLPSHKKAEMRQELTQELEKLESQYSNIDQAELESMPKFEDEDSESPYMSEQIKKDKKFSRKKPILLENNYKKFKNYHHWLTFNS